MRALATTQKGENAELSLKRPGLYLKQGILGAVLVALETTSLIYG
jgi:hypothetical protein